MTKVILGLDPGTATTGFGVIKEDKGVLEYVDCGYIATSKDKEPAQRLLIISESLEQIIVKYKPEIVAVESLFFAKNRATAIAVAQARGVLLAGIAKHKLLILEYTPLQIKQALTGYGQAEKRQMQKMVQAVLKLREMPKVDDSADALAVAICASYCYKAVLK